MAMLLVLRNLRSIFDFASYDTINGNVLCVVVKGWLGEGVGARHICEGTS